MKLSLWNCLLIPVLVIGSPSARADSEPTDEADHITFFEKKVRPILVSHCYSCHSADTKTQGDLRVDDRNGLLLGGNNGPAIVPGDPEHSLLIQRIKGEGRKKQMPREGDLLTDEEIADLSTWIRDGMAWPREHIPSYIGRVRADYADLKEHHWAWQPLTRPAAPAVTDTNWPLSDLDRFVLAKLEANKLDPVATADRTTLIRRVTYDLTGLPPTPDEVEAFLRDTSPDAWAQVVDRLLASPQYGIRWGRHWLDVARYGESTGPSRNIPYPYAWRYRDYVIDAVNRDIPYDRFLQEQIAGDLLPTEDPAEKDRLMTATGFLALGVKDVNQRFKTRFIMDNVDEQIDAVTRSTLALTVTCARCHDHKFDPIPVTDYYALAGIFTSTEDCAGVRNKMGGGGLDYFVPSKLIPLGSQKTEVDPAKVEKLEADVAVAKEAWDAIRGTSEGLEKGPNGQPKQRPFRLKYEKLQMELFSLTNPAGRGDAVHGVRENKTVGDTEVRIRGEAERLGPTVPRGFLTTFQVPDATPVDPQQSGRLQLAQWITSPKNPLTPRVIVNRVWQHLFGDGLVTTVDNFGVKGDVPTNPELLDYLAGQFVDDGWSVKKLIRSIVLSRAYQLGSEAPKDHVDIDPANRFIWRHSPRRLDAEEMRDSVLAATGQLQLVKPPTAIEAKLRMAEMRDNGPEARGVQEAADGSVYRSVYLPLLRGVTPKALEAFDPVSQTLVTGRRDATTVPTQALFLLNSSFIRHEALAYAEQVQIEEAAPDELISRLYGRVFNREPSSQEIERAKQFLTGFELAYAGETQDLIAAADTRPSTDESGSESGSAAPVPPVVPDNPDDIDRTPAAVREEKALPENGREAAWMSLVQALYGSAEFRFVR